MALLHVGPTLSGLRWRAMSDPALAGPEHHASPGDDLMVLAVQPDGPESGTIKYGRRRGLDRRPPALRLPPASISRAAFVRLIAIWLGAVLALMALALAIRLFG